MLLRQSRPYFRACIIPKLCSRSRLWVVHRFFATYFGVPQCGGRCGSQPGVHLYSRAGSRCWVRAAWLPSALSLSGVYCDTTCRAAACFIKLATSWKLATSCIESPLRCLPPVQGEDVQALTSQAEGAQIRPSAYSLHCSCFFWYTSRIQKGNPKKELQWRLWVDSVA